MARWLRWGGMALVVVLLLAILGVPLYAATPPASTITVSSPLDVLDAEDGVCTLREAISAANTDTPSGHVAGECEAGSGEDTILVPTGTYTLTIEGANEDANATGDLDIVADTIILATGAVTVNANQIDRIFHIRNYEGDVTLKGLTITGGRATQPSSGGGILSITQLRLEKCRIINNSSGSPSENSNYAGGGVAGGGIVSYNPLQIIDSEILSNTTDGFGGGIYYWSLAHQGLTIQNSRFEHNKAALGGGAVASRDSTVTIDGSLFRHNQLETGGYEGNGGGGGAIFAQALVVEKPSSLYITNSQFIENYAGDGTDGDEQGGNGGGGGAIASGAATTFVGNSSFFDNRAGRGGAGASAGVEGTGGAVSVGGANMTFVNITMRGNRGRLGGGMVTYGYTDQNSTFYLNRSTISGNSADQGAGLYLYAPTASIFNSTIVSNTIVTTGSGGGVFIELDSNTTIHNSIIANNNAAGISNDVYGVISGSSYLFLEDPIGATVEGEGNIYGQDPDLLPLADNGGTTYTHLPSDTSPVLDAGDCIPFVDQRSLPRPVDLAQPNAANGCDIGSVEVQGPVATPTATPTATASPTTPATSTPVSTNTPTDTTPTATPSPTNLPTMEWHLYLPLIGREP